MPEVSEYARGLFQSFDDPGEGGDRAEMELCKLVESNDEAVIDRLIKLFEYAEMSRQIWEYSRSPRGVRTARLLGHVPGGNDRAIEALLRHVGESSDFSNECLVSLVKIGSPAVPFIIRHMHTVGQSFNLLKRWSATAFALAMIRTPEAIEKLEDKTFGTQGQIAAAALLARELQQNPPRVALRNFARNLDHTRSMFPSETADCLVWYGLFGPESAEALAETLALKGEGEPTYSERHAAISCLTRMGINAAPAIPALAGVLAEEYSPIYSSPTIVDLAKAMLGDLSPLSIPALAVAAAPDIENRSRAALEILVLLGKKTPEAVDALRSALNRLNPENAAIAVGAYNDAKLLDVGGMGEWQNVLSKCSNPEAINVALRALGLIGEREGGSSRAEAVASIVSTILAHHGQFRWDIVESGGTALFRILSAVENVAIEVSARGPNAPDSAATRMRVELSNGGTTERISMVN